MLCYRLPTTFIYFTVDPSLRALTTRPATTRVVLLGKPHAKSSAKASAQEETPVSSAAGSPTKASTQPTAPGKLSAVQRRALMVRVESGEIFISVGLE